MNKMSTIRLPMELDEQLSKYAKENELSKNQVVKKAIREYLNCDLDTRSKQTA